MSRYLSYLLGTTIAVLLVAGPVSYSWYWQGRIRNFRTVRDGVLYRSGQLSLGGLKRIIHDYGIRTVVTLRDAALPGHPPPDRDEEEYCKAEEIRYVRIPPRTWWAADGSVPAEKGVREFLRVMDDSRNYPVLIHCFAGIHRSGAFCAVYRMEYENWSNAQAIAEMKACGYSHLDDEWDVLGYIEQYRPRKERPSTDFLDRGLGKSLDAAEPH
jgi:protein tyrosine/serine phosphatase